MTEAYDIASRNMEKSTAKGKAYYDRRKMSLVLVSGSCTGEEHVRTWGAGKAKITLGRPITCGGNQES
jgi:hypothetical protein